MTSISCCLRSKASMPTNGRRSSQHYSEICSIAQKRRWANFQRDSLPIGRQKPGTIPPVKIIGKGQDTPANWPSMRSSTSRNGEKPYNVPAVDSKVLTSELKVFVYQNSSVACPHAESEMTALSKFCGRVYDTDAVCPGTENALPMFFEDCCAEMGRIMSAVGGESGTVKKVAVNVV